MIIFWFILACLATHRLSLMFSKESGPARIFRKIRGLPEKGSSLREGLKCLWCESLWHSALVLFILMHPSMKFAGEQLGWMETFVLWLSVSTGAIIINQQWTKG